MAGTRWEPLIGGCQTPVRWVVAISAATAFVGPRLPSRGWFLQLFEKLVESRVALDQARVEESVAVLETVDK
jgi:hypothetical protein